LLIRSDFSRGVSWLRLIDTIPARRHDPLPDHALALLDAQLARGLAPAQAAIWTRRLLGHPEARWLDQLLELAAAPWRLSAV
jgi:hypothetical protein